MAAISPKKTAMKLRSVPKLFRSSLKFAENNTVNIAERDYGLMRVTAASGTPHPRVITGVNMDTLKERLEEEQEKNLQAKQIESEMEIDSGIHFKSDTSRRSHKKMRLVETPHPAKITNLDPKVLLTPRLMRGFKANDPSPWAARTHFSNLTVVPSISSYPSKFGSVRSSTYTKKIPTIKKTKETRKETGTKVAKKKVTLIPPKIIVTNSASSSSSSDSCNHLELLSFNERRRIFHEGEFTIAKNGRKMSDNMMPITSKAVYIGDPNDKEAERAQAEIDLYIKSQGFIMAPTGTLTNLRRFSSQLSKRSLPSKRASAQSVEPTEALNKKRKSGSTAKAPV
ncbi:uncharacterized protein LOC117791067 [Drosophila innubila]|uniref:uncharacterized protein LOC117791067 n=1 Tax=Drosophila innubila TaxID=198719 RepID=UPI00148DC522|nr:uncharacterized protein LOC117791067 [Drosophila innubila]